MNSSTNKENQPTMTLTQRWGGLYTVGLMILLLVFFAYHQWADTGFFTEKFIWLSMLALYGPIVISMAPPILRLIQGRRNPARLLDAAMDLSLAIGSIWLRITFPFDFTHLADPFPAAMRFAFAWLSNDIGRLILLLQIVIGFLSAFATLATYFSIRRKEKG